MTPDSTQNNIQDNSIPAYASNNRGEDTRNGAARNNLVRPQPITAAPAPLAPPPPGLKIQTLVDKRAEEQKAVQEAIALKEDIRNAEEKFRNLKALSEAHPEDAGLRAQAAAAREALNGLNTSAENMDRSGSGNHIASNAISSGSISSATSINSSNTSISDKKYNDKIISGNSAEKTEAKEILKDSSDQGINKDGKNPDTPEAKQSDGTQPTPKPGEPLTQKPGDQPTQPNGEQPAPKPGEQPKAPGDQPGQKPGEPSKDADAAATPSARPGRQARNFNSIITTPDAPAPTSGTANGPEEAAKLALAKPADQHPATPMAPAAQPEPQRVASAPRPAATGPAPV